MCRPILCPHIFAVRAFSACGNSKGHWNFPARLRAVMCLFAVAAHAELMPAAAGIRFRLFARGNEERAATQTPPLTSNNVRAAEELRPPRASGIGSIRHGPKSPGDSLEVQRAGFAYRQMVGLAARIEANFAAECKPATTVYAPCPRWSPRARCFMPTADFHFVRTNAARLCLCGLQRVRQ